jgi:hypothetical protein
MRPSTIPDPPTTAPVPADTPSPPAPSPADPGAPDLGLDAVALAAAAELPQETAAEEITDDQSWLVQKLRDPRTIFSFLLAIALLVFIFTRFDVQPTEIWGVIQHANLGMFGLAFVV